MEETKLLCLEIASKILDTREGKGNYTVEELLAEYQKLRDAIID